VLGTNLLKVEKYPQPNKRIFRRMIFATEEILPPKGFNGVEIYGFSRIDVSLRKSSMKTSMR